MIERQTCGSGATGHPCEPTHHHGFVGIGFVYLPAVVGVAVASIMTAPIGARKTHQLPVATLKRIFAAILLVLAGKMLWGLFSAP